MHNICIYIIHTFIHMDAHSLIHMHVCLHMHARVHIHSCLFHLWLKAEAAMLVCSGGGVATCPFPAGGPELQKQPLSRGLLKTKEMYTLKLYRFQGNV